ncbi:hypothetical protein VNO77_16043 [Canavalia gladiata]|uniref:Uncharacterized protein n=1 Tax=Canavalia gladiata TaxID=3824 RepID=A0AAN9QRN9_CANGL
MIERKQSVASHHWVGLLGKEKGDDIKEKEGERKCVCDFVLEATGFVVADRNCPWFWVLGCEGLQVWITKPNQTNPQVLCKTGEPRRRFTILTAFCIVLK